MSLTLPIPDGQTVMPSPVDTGGQASPAAFAATGTAVEQGGAQFAQSNDYWANREALKQQQHDMVAAGSKVVAQTRWDLTQQLQTAKQNAQPGAPGFTPAFMSQVDTTIGAATKDLDPMIQDYVTEHLGYLRDTLGQQAVQFEAGASVAKRQQDLDDTVNLHANVVRSDPSQFEQSLGETLGAVAGSGIEPVLHKEAELHVKNTLAGAAVEGMIDRDPAGAVKTLNSGQFDAFLAPSAKNALLERATALADRNSREGQAQFQSNVQNGLKDEFAAIEATGQGTGNPAVAPNNIKAVYGDQAPAVLQELDLARKGWNARQSVALTGPDDDAATIKTFTPAAPASGGVPYAVQQSEQNALVKTIQDKYTAFARDPAAYVQSASPGLQAAYAAAQSDPAKMPAAIALSDQLQTKIAGSPDFQPPVLSETQAKGLVAKITSAPVDQAGPALQALQAQFGAAWPRVWTDLQAKGKLPAAYQVLGTIDDPNTRTDLAAALRTKPAELDANAGTENVKAVKAAVTDQLGPFFRSLSVVPNGDSQIAAYRNSAEVLATHYVAQGMDPGEAATKAASGIVTSRYDIADGPGFNARAPAGTLPLVQRYAGQVLDGLKQDDIQPPKAPGIDPATASTIYYQDHVETGSQWVSQGDDRWMLLDSARNPVLLKSGQPVGFAVKDAIAAPDPATSPTVPDAAGNLHPNPAYRRPVVPALEHLLGAGP